MHYWGESHRKFHDRIQEHFRDLGQMKPENPLVKQMLLHHPGEEPYFTFKVDKSWKSTLARQTCKALRIGKSKSEELINGKAE